MSETNPTNSARRQSRKMTEAPTPVAVPTTRPLEALQIAGREPLTIWKTKGPKNVSGGLEIAAGPLPG